MEPVHIAIVLYVAALVLAFVDLFIPSGAMLIVLAAVAAFAAVLFAFRASTSVGMTMLTVVAATVPTFAFAAIKIWPLTPIGKRIILNVQPTAGGASDEFNQSLEHLIGEIAVTDGALMPSGQVKIGAKRFNCIAETGLLESGVNVEVVAVRERNLIVRLTTRQPASKTSLPAAVRSEQIAAHELSPETLLDLPAEQFDLDSIDGTLDQRPDGHLPG